ncbi:MAG: hypothetical protein K2X98_02690 [Alphaproteobacteria bacterium]|nr:hypothetical protein [Alphaproteobacteria bacterium]MBX9977140.1 hypothetical protein [Alphaproteobacteria bacterium]
MTVFSAKVRLRCDKNRAKVLAYYLKLQERARLVIDTPRITTFSYKERHQGARIINRGATTDAAWYEWSLLLSFLEYSEPGSISFMDTFLSKEKHGDSTFSKQQEQFIVLMGLVDTFKRHYKKSVRQLEM